MIYEKIADIIVDIICVQIDVILCSFVCAQNKPKNKRESPKTIAALGLFGLVGEDGFEPSKRNAADLQSVPFGVIYISIGTILKGAEKFFRACMDAFQNENVMVVMSVGKNFDIAKLGKLPENFIVRNHIPQVAVLKQAGLFITHGGMNSVSEAMVSGVPMLVIPFVSDQPVNARQVEKLGLGKVLDYKTITANALRDAAFAIMENQQIQENLRKIQNEIAHAPGNRGAVKIIEEYFKNNT